MKFRYFSGRLFTGLNYPAFGACRVRISVLDGVQKSACILLLCAGVIVSNPVLARQSNFNTAAFTFLDSNAISFDCSLCHSDLSANDADISVSAPATLQQGKTQLLLTANGQETGTDSSFIWRYRIGSQTIEDSEYNNPSKSVSVSSSGNIALKYCIADAEVALDETTRRRWHCGSQTVTRTPPPNTPPSITQVLPASPLAVGIDEIKNVTVSALDSEDQAALVYDLVGPPPAKVTVDITRAANGSSATYAIKGVSPGSETLTLRVSDGKTSVTRNYTVNVTSVNQAPVITNVQPATTLNMGKGESRTFFVLADDDNDAASALDYTFSVTPASGANVTHEGSGEFAVEALEVGQTSIDINVTDSEGLASSVQVTLIIVDVVTPNNPPIITSPAANAIVNLTVNSTVTLSVVVDDENPESVVLSVKPVVAGIISVDSQPGGQLVLTGMSPGSTVLQITATDNRGESDVVQVSVVVVANNKPPVAQADQFIFNFQSESQLLDVLANDSDPEGAVLGLSLDTAQSTLGGTIEVAGNSVLYTAPPNLSSDDSFTYRALDEIAQQSSAATVIVKPSDFDSDTVFDGNDNCVLLANTDQADADADETGDICDADPDGDGVLGEVNNPFATGKSLVESVCAECHSEVLSGAPQIGDKDAWAARIAAAPNGIFTLIDSVTNGKGDMPARGALNTARELSQAVLYLTGIEDPAVSSNFNDRDLDGVADLLDNCLNFANADQADTDGNGIGDACEPDSDGVGRLDYSASLVIFQKTDGANRNGAIILENGGDTTMVARTRADLEGLSYNWSGSSPEIRAAIGNNASGNVVVIPAGSLTSGTFTVAVTVKGAGITGQTRKLLTVLDTTDDVSDPDFDGYPATVDADNANANRMQANPGVAGSDNLFLSPSALSMGRFSAELASTTGYATVRTVLSESELRSVSQALFPGVTPDAESSVGSSIGIMDLELHALDTTLGVLIVQLQANIPFAAGLKMYNPVTGQWAGFVESGGESLSSAPALNNECPPANSANYSAGLAVGKACVRISLLDGGQNDSDGSRDGVISITGVLGRTTTDQPAPSGPPVVNANHSKGGGTAGPALLAVVVLCLWRRFSARRSV